MQANRTEVEFMLKVLCAVFVALLAINVAGAQSSGQGAMEAEIAAPIGEVLVTGEQPGPGLWKVIKGDHILWILGTQAPLPKKMTWRSAEVEKIVANSQELLTNPSVDAR